MKRAFAPPRCRVGVACAFAVVAVLARADGAEPVVHDHVEYREIAGDSEAALVGALRRIAVTNEQGQGFSGHTHWHLRWNVDFESVDGSCRMSAFATDLDIRMSLPRWSPPAGASKDLVARWNAFVAALRVHEDGHRAIALAAARELARRAGQLAATADCAASKRAINALTAQTLEEYRGEERAYDERTDHGRTQGAHFP